MDLHDDRGSSNTRLLAGLGLGALLVVALSSRRGRQALSGAAGKAGQALRRAPPALHQLSSTVGGRTTRYGMPQEHGGALGAASGALQRLADRANELAWSWTSRARRLSAKAKAKADRPAATARSPRARRDESIGDEMDWVARRVPGRALLLVAASLGALYAVQRHGLLRRLRPSHGRPDREHEAPAMAPPAAGPLPGESAAQGRADPGVSPPGRPTGGDSGLRAR